MKEDIRYVMSALYALPGAFLGLEAGHYAAVELFKRLPSPNDGFTGILEIGAYGIILAGSGALGMTASSLGLDRLQDSISRLLKQRHKGLESNLSANKNRSLR